MDEEKAKRIEEIAKNVNKLGGPVQFEGITFPPFPGLFPDPEKKFQEIRDFECRQSDVFLCTYPKAGTHWALEILGMLINQSAKYDLIFVGDVFIEVIADKEKLNKAESPRVIMAHLPYKYLPLQVRNGVGKIIYIQRNPKDLFVSLFNFQRGKQAIGAKMTWDQFFDTMFGGDAVYGGWFQYTKDWEEQFSSKNILPLYYEDMKNDLPAHVLKIAKYLELPCSDDLADEIGEKCSFENMKSNKVDHTQKMNTTGGDNPSLYRKGKVGDWKNWFTVGQNERFDDFYKEEMKNSKLQFKYEL